MLSHRPLAFRLLARNRLARERSRFDLNHVVRGVFGFYTHKRNFLERDSSPGGI